MGCEHELIHAYHDGELTPGRRTAVEAHLAGCAECRDLLADLRRVSKLVADASLVEMPPQAITRMQQAWWSAAQERGVLRIASWLTAAAAAVIFAAVIFSPTERGEGNSSWQAAALTPPTELAEEAQDNEIVIAAQWIANDLSLAERR